MLWSSRSKALEKSAYTTSTWVILSGYQQCIELSKINCHGRHLFHKIMPMNNCNNFYKCINKRLLMRISNTLLKFKIIVMGP